MAPLSDDEDKFVPFHAADVLHYKLKPAEFGKLKEIWSLLKTDTFTLSKGMEYIEIEGVNTGNECLKYLQNVDSTMYAYRDDEDDDEWKWTFLRHSNTLFKNIISSIPCDERPKQSYTIICGNNYISPFMLDLPLHFAQTMTVFQGQVRRLKLHVQIWSFYAFHATVIC